MKKILVIDGNSIINRAFYGIRPLTTKSGKHTNAIYGMINIISKQMKGVHYNEKKDLDGNISACRCSFFYGDRT